MMSTVVSAELTGELAQILFNLTLEDNETRSACVSFLCVVIVDCIEGGGTYSSAEKSLNERLEQMPDLVITVLGQFTVAADTEVVSS